MRFLRGRFHTLHVQLHICGTPVSDDFTAEDEFAETHGVWWTGIVFATVVTFAIIGGLMLSGPMC